MYDLYEWLWITYFQFSDQTIKNHPLLNSQPLFAIAMQRNERFIKINKRDFSPNKIFQLLNWTDDIEYQIKLELPLVKSDPILIRLPIGARSWSQTSSQQSRGSEGKPCSGIFYNNFTSLILFPLFWLLFKLAALKDPIPPYPVTDQNMEGKIFNK